jgi:acetylornithine deacetylase
MTDKLRQAVWDRIEENWDTQLAFLREIVAHESVLFRERPVQLAMQRKFASMDLEVDVFDADVSQLGRMPGYSPVEWGYRGRPQVVGVLRGAGGGKRLVLNGHVDVVPTEPLHHWTVDPLSGVIRDGRLYGRGAQDMKAGVSALTFAVQAIQECGVQLRGDVILQSVIEEEATGNGTLACLARGWVGDACLIPEPFDQRILLGEVGVLWVRSVFRGAAGHVLGASRLVNAIDLACRYVTWLRELEREWNAVKHPAWAEVDHPLNVNPGVIQGGVWPSSVPSEVTLVTRFAFFPDVTPDEAKERFLAFMRSRTREDAWFRDHPIEFTWYGHHDHGYTIPREDPFVQAVARAHTEVTGRPAEYNVATAVTDCRFWVVHERLPATCYGPSGAGLHGADEWVDLRSVKEVTKVIATLALDYCGVASGA